MDELMDSAPCGFVSLTDDGTIADANRTLLEMLDWAAVDILGWHIDKILPPGGRIFYHTYVFPLLRMQNAVEEIYLALRTRDARDVPVLLNGIRRERGGRVVNDCIVMKMIQRHEYEDQLLEARRLAEESSAAKAKFLSMMSHDLRTPLTTIDGNAQLLQVGEHGELTDDQNDAVRTIRDACRLQLTLITDILEFARLDSGRVDAQLGIVPVQDVITRAVTLVHFQAHEAGLTLVASDCTTDARVVADPDRLQQVLLNLLTNAVKFTPPGGEVSVSCDVHAGRVSIHVRDTGIGIPVEALPRIFTPFVQLASTDAAERPAISRGVGLGLAISRDLARAMKGDVTVESTPGTGSTFTIHLPAADALAAVE